MKKYLLLLVSITCLAIAGCSSTVWDQINLMPSPDAYHDGMLNPLPDQNPIEQLPYHGLLYATDRLPASEAHEEKYYANQRGHVLRLGVARVSLHEADVSWEELRKISLLKERPDKYPIKVTGIEEFGILEDTIPPFAERGDYSPQTLDGDEEFANAVNQQLARSKRKHVFVYVHGYKAVFENPVLIASELWHFMGYDGVMIGYAWPATPSRWAYLKDLDTITGYARHFRKFLEYLAESTDAEEIHVIGYSAGTRMVVKAYEQLGLIYHNLSREEKLKKLRMGSLTLIGSDIDRHVFISAMADGALDVPRHTRIYVSDKDKVLGYLSWLTPYKRLGEMISDGELPPQIRQLLFKFEDRISFINVSDTEGAGAGNGHYYFRSSQKVASDILMTLMYDFSNQQRGLMRKENTPIWEFSADYLEQLWESIAEIDTEFGQKYQADIAE
jgi:esterase/lipase superfamily enzyme